MQAVGFEYVTIMDDYYPPNKGHWWTSLLRQPSPSCVPHQILQADNFMTNTSIFNYVVNSINATANKLATYPTSSTSGLSGIQYTAEPLAAACDVQNGIRILRLATDIVQNTVTGYVSICAAWKTPSLINQVLGAIQLLLCHIGYACNRLLHDFLPGCPAESL